MWYYQQSTWLSPQSVLLAMSLSFWSFEKSRKRVLPMFLFKTWPCRILCSPFSSHSGLWKSMNKVIVYKIQSNRKITHFHNPKKALKSPLVWDLTVVDNDFFSLPMSRNLAFWQFSVSIYQFHLSTQLIRISLLSDGIICRSLLLRMFPDSLAKSAKYNGMGLFWVTVFS